MVLKSLSFFNFILILRKSNSSSTIPTFPKKLSATQRNTFTNKRLEYKKVEVDTRVRPKEVLIT